MVFLLFFLLIHILMCIIIYFGTKARVFKFSKQMLPIIFFVPIWGFLLAVSADYYGRRNKTGSLSVNLEDAHIDKNDYRLIEIQQDNGKNSVIPLEEAMTINDIDVRRELMTDILYRNPAENIGLLQEARLNDDIEVTHYASTAIMEIQREYEIDLQKTEKNYNEHPQQINSLNEYLSAMRRYINSGLIADNLLFIYRKKYVELLEVQIQKSDGNAELYCELVDNYLAIDLPDFAKIAVKELISKWPENELAWFAKIKYSQYINDGEMIKDTVEEVKRRNVYLSSEGKIKIAFWDQTN